MGKIVINQTDEKQTIILTNDSEGVTGGYYDRQEVWHEFGGGGGVSSTPILTVTFSIDIPEGYEAYLGTNPIYIKDSQFFVYSNAPRVYNNDKADYVIPYVEAMSLAGTEVNMLASVQGNPDSYAFIPSNMVNCSYELIGGRYAIVITDPTKNASATMTATLEEG